MAKVDEADGLRADLFFSVALVVVVVLGAGLKRNGFSSPTISSAASHFPCLIMHWAARYLQAVE